MPRRSLKPGVPDEREYQLIAMKNDQVIGPPSPILSMMVGRDGAKAFR